MAKFLIGLLACAGVSVVITYALPHVPADLRCWANAAVMVTCYVVGWASR